MLLWETGWEAWGWRAGVSRSQCHPEVKWAQPYLKTTLNLDKAAFWLQARVACTGSVNARPRNLP